MARGWESKSVEAQQADREQARSRGGTVAPEEAARLAQRRALELSRARTVADLHTARSPAHRAMLEAALRALDEQLRACGPADVLRTATLSLDAATMGKADAPIVMIG